MTLTQELSSAGVQTRSTVEVTTVAPAARNVAVDAYRGLVMLLMMGEILQFSSQVAHAYPGSLFWRILAYNQTHVPWAGCSLHDHDSAVVHVSGGVALPYSIASRCEKARALGGCLAHTILASVPADCAGNLSSVDVHPQTNFTFEDTLTQIGMGYTFCFLLAFLPPKWQWIALGAILLGYWLAWALYPAPGAGLRLRCRGCSGGLALQLHRFRGALEQEQQPWRRRSIAGS